LRESENLNVGTNKALRSAKICRYFALVCDLFQSNRADFHRKVRDILSGNKPASKQRKTEGCLIFDLRFSFMNGYEYL
jgi:hypothetical protein